MNRCDLGEDKISCRIEISAGGVGTSLGSGEVARKTLESLTGEGVREMSDVGGRGSQVEKLRTGVELAN